ncbi:HAD hydrolase-like protein [Streptomyces sp. NPDC001508]|uniref:HAD hydrolase-like protein n=1 Tax=Streptomyces sp. NPDC001508 TaxID=3154656 RepID=UPI00331660FA
MKDGNIHQSSDKVRPGLLVADLVGTTIADPVESAINEALVHVGSSRVDPQKLAPLRGGLKKRDVFAALLGDDEDKVESAYRHFDRAVLDAIESGRVSPIPHAENTLRTLAEAGVTIAFTTGLTRRQCPQIIEALGWTDLVDCVISAEDTRRGRPYPDMIFEAIVRTGTRSVRETAVVGDTTNDLWAGDNAGVAANIGVLTGAHSSDQLRAAPHHTLLESVAQLPEFLRL